MPAYPVLIGSANMHQQVANAASAKRRIGYDKIAGGQLIAVIQQSISGIGYHIVLRYQ